MKVFQIGFNRCGTRTIHSYFDANRIRSVHWDAGRLARRIFTNLANGDDLLDGYSYFDVFTDMEWLDDAHHCEAYKLFPYFAAQYPDAVFILNTRDREAGSGAVSAIVMGNPPRATGDTEASLRTSDWSRPGVRNGTVITGG
jgi:hypothetical protein